ncbi:GntR family transcriptional regulator [Bacillus sp. Cr_A10]|uniref:GntR family transcriptional regulator n=1 Tax=Bacillus sp. Cr_A10 TaxID=3033993 RepID=UPI0031F344B8
MQNGEKITELQMAQDLDVSRTFVREAILLLELEGLLFTESNKVYNLDFRTIHGLGIFFRRGTNI